MNAHLMEREQQVLTAVIEIYTRTAEPVSSSQVCGQYSFNCSSATIRSCMLKLEEQGYLSHPYTSAGKCPTYKAYRFFLGHLMDRQVLNREEQARIRLQLINSICETDQMIRLTARLLAATSELMGLAWITMLDRVCLQKIQLIGLSGRQLLLIAYLDNGEIRHQPFEASFRVEQNMLKKVVKIINQKAGGRAADELKQMASKQWQGLDQPILKLLRQALLLVSHDLEYQLQHENILLEGTSNLISQPEFDNINAVRKTMAVLEEKSLMAQSLLEPGIQKGAVKITLGADQTDRSIPALSMISHQMVLRDGRSARLAIVGPRRMAYNRLISVMNCATTTLTGLSI